MFGLPTTSSPRGNRVPYQVEITARPAYLPEHSNPTEGQYAFSYTISIRNDCEVDVQLISRRWVISHGSGKVENVEGPGVVGQQPRLAPGESFSYTSGAILDAPVGTMEGHYHMRAEDGHSFDAPIPRFRLSVPGVLN